MEFCVISPTSGLERYAKLSKTHLVLAHECDNHDYLQFYIKRQMEGDFLILDNGAYEKGEPAWDYNLVQGLQPKVIVLPDYPLQPWRKTWHAAIAHLDKYSHDAQEFEWLYIPQAEPGDLNGFIRSYQEAVGDERITWIGIPRALAYAITPDPLMRVKFAELVLSEHPNISLHAFGMVNGDIHELPYLARLGVKSVDSSAPVWRGWNGFDIKDKPIWERHGSAVNFNAESIPAPSGRDALILHNLEACGVDTSSIRG